MPVSAPLGTFTANSRGPRRLPPKLTSHRRVTSVLLSEARAVELLPQAGPRQVRFPQARSFQFLQTRPQDWILSQADLPGHFFRPNYGRDVSLQTTLARAPETGVLLSYLRRYPTRIIAIPAKELFANREQCVEGHLLDNQLSFDPSPSRRFAVSIPVGVRTETATEEIDQGSHLCRELPAWRPYRVDIRALDWKSAQHRN